MCRVTFALLFLTFFFFFIKKKVNFLANVKPFHTKSEMNKPQVEVQSHICMVNKVKLST